MLNRLINGLIQLVYPATCVACKNKLKEAINKDGFLCLSCRDKIKINTPPFCARCGRHLEAREFAKNICRNCIKQMLHFDRAFSPCVYEGVMKELIHEFKYKNRDYIGSSLSNFMIDFIKEYELPIDYIDFLIPVPLHKRRLREREFNQAEVLAKSISNRFKKETRTDILYRERETKRQIDLTPEERLLNVQNSFSVKNEADIKNKNILLVDDVFTTGATSSEASLALKSKGAAVVFVLTLAN